jgi:hypothetical protein
VCVCNILYSVYYDLYPIYILDKLQIIPTATGQYIIIEVHILMRILCDSGAVGERQRIDWDYKYYYII